MFILHMLLDKHGYENGGILKCYAIYATNSWIVNRKATIRNIFKAFWCNFSIARFVKSFWINCKPKSKFHVAIFFTALWKFVSIQKVIYTKYLISNMHWVWLHTPCYGAGHEFLVQIRYLDPAVYMVHWPKLYKQVVQLHSNKHTNS